MTSKDNLSKEEIIKVEGPMTIYEISKIRDRLLKAVDKSEEVVLDLEEVDNCDVSGIQLLASAVRTGQDLGVDISIINRSGAVTETAKKIGIVI